jgi:riboflavin synthase
MFTGIIEAMGQIIHIEHHGTNVNFHLKSSISSELKIDQSLSHNGACLTITEVEGDIHQVTAIAETLQKTNLGDWKVGDLINLERSMLLNGRLDGHIVQGHVDQVAVCTTVETLAGSWAYTFEYEASLGNVTVEKGSVCVNGVSLTVVNSGKNYFSVAIIPYTYEHTNFKNLQKGMKVNLEFDIIGKYVQKLLASNFIH